MVRSRLTQVVTLLLIVAGSQFVPDALAKVPATGKTLHEAPRVEGQVLVQYKLGFRQEFIEARLLNLGLTRLDRFRAVNMDLLQLPAGFDLETFASELRREAMFTLVEPNFIYGYREVRPDDARYQNQWHLENDGTNYVGNRGAGLPGADINAINAWEIQALGAGSIIAVIDDAVETGHEDLTGNIVSGGKCFDSATNYCSGPDNPNPAGSSQDHGTLVAGTAAARGNNGIGVAGVAWQAGILPYKTDLTNAAITASINDAITRGAHIINMSFGGAAPSESVRAALAAAQSSGIIAIASAGNADANNDKAKAHYPSNYTLPNVIAVAASDGYDDITDFSQWGPFTVELAAPGRSVQTTALNNSYRSVAGTSFSSPIVAGVAALIRSQTGVTGPEAWKRIRAHLLYGGVNGVGLGPTLVPGRDRKAVPGRVQTGRLDAARALAGPPGGVIVISGFTVDDSVSGNGNGLLDPFETADLVVELENVWTAESNVVGTLVPFDSENIPNAFESGQLSVTDPTQSFGDMAQDQRATARFPVSLGDVPGNEHYFLTLQLESDSGALPERYFSVEIGTLRNNIPVTQTIQRLNFDEFHAWHIDVPPGSSNLVISTTADNPSGGTCRHIDGNDYPASIDIDLLVRYGTPPEYAIALDPPEGSASFYTDPATQVDGNCGGHETITVTDPQAGIYHIVVVNFDQVQHDYTISAVVDGPPEGSITFNRGGFEVDEDDGVAVLSVSRSGSSGAVSVDYATRGGSAQEGIDYLPRSGTLSWADGESGTKTFSVPVVDDLEIELDEAFFVDLSNAQGGATISPPVTATVTIKDNDNPGELAFSAPTYSVEENGLIASIGVRRINGSKGALAVDYRTSNGSATAGQDYQPSSGTLFWAAGDSQQKFFEVVVLEDAIREVDETVALVLENPTPDVPLTLSEAQLVIGDNDDAGSIRFEPAVYVVSETDARAIVRVRRVGDDLAGIASIDFQTVDGSAVAGSDYQATSGTLSWLPGEGGTKTIAVDLIDDFEPEAAEIFEVELSNPSNGVQIEGPTTASVTIEDDDNPGAVRFLTSSMTINEGFGTVTVTVLRVGGSSGPVGVDFATQSGTAQSGSDFEASNGTLGWTDGDTAGKDIVITILDDAGDENDETFSVVLSSPQNGVRLGTPSVMTVSITDNDTASGNGGGGGGGGGAPNPLLLLAVLPLLVRGRRRKLAA